MSQAKEKSNPTLRRCELSWTVLYRGTWRRPEASWHWPANTAGTSALSRKLLVLSIKVFKDVCNTYRQWIQILFYFPNPGVLDILDLFLCIGWSQRVLQDYLLTLSKSNHTTSIINNAVVKVNKSCCTPKKAFFAWKCFVANLISYVHACG